MPCTKKTNAVRHKKNCGISQASKNDVFCPSFQWLAAKNKHSVSNGKKKAAGRKLENFPMQQKKNKISQCKQEKLWHLAKGK
jgi:alpha-glucosidase (family GH31 glycosyl hydrolase)